MSGCAGKAAYRSFAHAARIARRIRRADDEPIQPYRCGACRMFHVGHAKPPMRVKKREE